MRTFRGDKVYGDCPIDRRQEIELDGSIAEVPCCYGRLHEGRAADCRLTTYFKDMLLGKATYEVRKFTIKMPTPSTPPSTTSNAWRPMPTAASTPRLSRRRVAPRARQTAVGGEDAAAFCLRPLRSRDHVARGPADTLLFECLPIGRPTSDPRRPRRPRLRTLPSVVRRQPLREDADLFAHMHGVPAVGTSDGRVINDSVGGGTVT
jgi:hypothetical protein